MMTAVLFSMEDRMEIKITEPVRFTFHVLIEIEKTIEFQKTRLVYFAKCLELCVVTDASSADEAIERIVHLMKVHCATGIRLSQIGSTNLLVPMKRGDFEKFWNFLRLGKCELVKDGRIELTDEDINDVPLPDSPEYKICDTQVQQDFWKNMVFEYQIFVKSEHTQ